MKLPLVYEMETGDPDDFWTLLWVADHPCIDLRAVMVTPGGRDQCQLVQWALQQCNPACPIGIVQNPAWWSSFDGARKRVAPYHYKAYGTVMQDISPTVQYGPWLLQDLLRRTDLTYLAGSPPKVLGEASRRGLPAGRRLRWVQQGGFAGDSLVAPAHRLSKFAGRETRPSYNVGGAPKQVMRLLSDSRVSERHFISKNVCHGVRYEKPVQLPQTARTGLRLMAHGMNHHYWSRGRRGKALHDLVAAVYALNPNVCRMSPEVQIYRKRDKWGARPKASTNTWISVEFHRGVFLTELLDQ